MRHDGRKETMLRPVKIQTNVYKHPEGSVVISFGDTTVICSATIEDRVPPFLRDTEKAGSQPNTVCSHERPTLVIVEKVPKASFLVGRWRSNG